MRRLTLFVLALIGLLFSIPLPTQAQPSDNPYIYYFLDKRSAFVIERADGTDTRLLGEGLMPPDVSRVSGPGWSPSGRWFAWRAEVDAWYGRKSSEKSYLIRSDGQVSTLLDGIKDAEMIWLPHRDLLLVTSGFIDNGSLHRLIFLVDPIANTRITLRDEIPFGLDGGMIGDLLPFSIDDQHVAVQYYTEQRIHFLIIDSNSHVVEKSFPDVLFSGNYSRFLYVSSNGNVTYRYVDSLMVENLVTGKRQTFLDIGGENPTISWSPNGDYALLFGDELWLLSLKTNALYLLQSKGPFDLSHWTDENIRIWSPNSRHALFAFKSELYHIAVEQAKITELTDFRRGEYGQLDWSWQTEAKAVVYFRSSTPISLIDLDAGTTEKMPFDTFGITLPSLSNDGRYMAYMDDGPIIVNRQTNTRLVLRPAATAYSSFTDGEVVWHKDSNWLFAFDNSIQAGGAPCCRHISIIRADGAVQRDLTFVGATFYYGIASPISADWLPPQVNLADLPHALKRLLYPTPSLVLKGSEWQFELSWSPDGKQLAGRDSRVWNVGRGAISVWNVAASKPYLTFNVAERTQHISWIHNPDNSYHPTLITIPEGQPLAISPDGEQKVEYNARWGVYTVKTDKMVIQIGDNRSSFTSASFSPDGQLLALGDAYQPAVILDTHSWRKVAELRFPAPAVAFSPDGKYLAASSAWDVNIWKVSDLLAQDTF